MRVGAFFEVHPNGRLLVEGLSSSIVRLMARVRLRTPEGWSDARPALIDLGSPYCVIPHSVWRAAEHRILVPEPFQVAGMGGEVTMAFYGLVTLAAEDEAGTSPALRVRSLLLEDDREPFLLGFEDLFTQSVLHCDYERRFAYLEFAAAGRDSGPR